MLALASSALSGQSRVATGEGRGDLPSPRPSWLARYEYRGPGWCTISIYIALGFTRGWQEGWERRAVYWTGYEIIYGQWAWRGMEYPHPGQGRYKNV